MEKYALLPKGDHGVEDEERVQTPTDTSNQSFWRQRSWLLVYLIVSHIVFGMAMVGFWVMRNEMKEHFSSPKIWSKYSMKTHILASIIPALHHNNILQNHFPLEVSSAQNMRLATSSQSIQETPTLRTRAPGKL